MRSATSFYRRGFTFEPMDVYKSDATRFLVTETGLIPPFTSMPGIGEQAALSIVEERKNGKFLSAEELIVRCPKASKAVVELLEQIGALGSMPKTTQMTLFLKGVMIIAKYEKHLTGNFDELLELVTDGVLNGSMSASYENGSDWTNGTVRCAVRVFERYSYMGGNRVSMNVTLVGNDRDLFFSAITSGGSQAVFFKLNTLGEESFLEKLVPIVENYKKESRVRS